MRFESCVYFVVGGRGSSADAGAQRWLALLHGGTTDWCSSKAAHQSVVLPCASAQGRWCALWGRTGRAGAVAVLGRRRSWTRRRRRRWPAWSNGAATTTATTGAELGFWCGRTRPNKVRGGRVPICYQNGRPLVLCCLAVVGGGGGADGRARRRDAGFCGHMAPVVPEFRVPNLVWVPAGFTVYADLVW